MLKLPIKNCFRCGSCISVCNFGALKIQYNKHKGFYEIILDPRHCHRCGLCTEICPFLEPMDSQCVNDPSSYYIGNKLRIMLAHSNYQKVRVNATSGGVINSLIRYLIENNCYHEALVLKENNNECVKASGYTINIDNVKELSENPRAFASRYISYPLGIYFRNINQTKKYIVVGTPCQIRGLKNILNLKHYNNLLLLGIACSGAISYMATEELFRRNGADISKQIYYRGDGWPGKNQITFLKNGVECSIQQNHQQSLFNTMFISHIFVNNACYRCKDHLAECSDIAFFDLWNKQEMNSERIGNTGIIIRTELGKEIIEEAENHKYINIIRELKPEEVIDSQKWVLSLKKDINYNLAMKLFSLIAALVFHSRIYRFFSIQHYRFISALFYKMVNVGLRLKRQSSHKGVISIF